MKTIETLVNEGLVIAPHIREETLLIHGTFDGNSCEARVIITIDLPDGREMVCNKVIRCRLVARRKP